jgi:hypothetical protein
MVDKTSDDYDAPSDDDDDGVSADWIDTTLKYLNTHRFDLVMAVFMVFIGIAVYALLSNPYETYRVYGDIIRIDEDGMLVEVSRVGFNVNLTVVPDQLQVSSGLCFMNQDFGLARCGLGAHVEIIRYVTAFREFWYVSAVLKDLDDYGVAKE